MSMFAVTIEKVSEVISPAPNADNLDIVKPEGKDYQVVTQKGLYATGDVIIYFPDDSLLPENLVDTLGLTNKLATGNTLKDGKKIRNRIKTIKLRGNISQGFVCPPSLLIDAGYIDESDVLVGNDITNKLGVVKYEPPPVASMSGNLVALPAMLSRYDIENAENYPAVIQNLINEKVYIAEKLEGSHWWISIDDRDDVIVGQRNYSIVPIEDKEHDWYRAARLHGFTELIREVKGYIESATEYGKQKRLTMRGEIIGPKIQGNYYNLDDFVVYIFEIECNGKPIDSAFFIWLANKFNFKTPPMLAYGVTMKNWLSERNLKDASTGYSRINSAKLREGIVIKPMYEMYYESIGRVVLKQRSPEYLAQQ